MTRQQLRDEALTLLFAGHETTALALTYALSFLARFPDVQRRLQVEVRRVLGGRTPTVDDVRKLVFAELVVKETMRLCPPIYLMGREVIRSFAIGSQRFSVGTQLLVSQWVVNRDERWYSRPEHFDPDRFAPEVSRTRPRFAYFPFGGGPRVCIGSHFAMLEAVLMLAVIVSHFRVELVDPAAALRFRPSVTLQPVAGSTLVRMIPRAQGGSIPPS